MNHDINPRDGNSLNVSILQITRTNPYISLLPIHLLPTLRRFPPPQLNLRHRIRHNREIMNIIAGPLRLPILSSHEPHLPIHQQMDQHDLDLVASKEPTGTSMVAMTKTQRFGRSSDELVFVFVSGYVAEIVEA